MSDIVFVLLSITGLFALFLVAKNSVARNLKYCTICLAVGVTWILLLLLEQLDQFDNQLVVGILMGQSSLGVYYLLEKRVSKNLLIFRLPVLLTLTLLVYTVISQVFSLDAWLVTSGVWLVATIFYIYRTHPTIKGKVEALIECCSDW